MSIVQIMPDSIPQEKIDILARAALRAIRIAYEDPQFQAEYECWLAKRRGCDVGYRKE